MNDKFIHEIAEKIVKEEILGYWKLYLLMLAVSLIGVFFYGYITGYGRTRGQNFATKADFDQLIEQVRKTTEATEVVKTAIARTDWAEKEWKTLRKIKLEEFLSSVYEIPEWIEKETNYRLYNEPKESINDPFNKVRMITILYFAEELGDETDALAEIIKEYKIFLMETHQKIIEDKAKQTETLKKTQPEMLAHHKKLITAKNNIDFKAIGVMKTLAGI